MRRYDSAYVALAAAVTCALWLHQAFSTSNPPIRLLIDRAIFLFALVYAGSELGRALYARARRLRLGVSPNPAVKTAGSANLVRVRWQALGTSALALLIVVQTVAHLGARGAYLYVTRPGFPTGVGVSADGYVAWMDGHPVYAEAWQFGKLANLFAGASTDLDTGDHDARGAHSYLAALLAKPMGFIPAFLALNLAFWLSGSLAMWYVGRALMGSEQMGFVAALLTACGQGFVFMSSTPMSYVAGYAWAALLLALSVRWQTFGWTAEWRRWLVWGVVCGVSGLFYFTHVVALGAAWIFGAARAPLRCLLLATAVALLVPASWFVVGTELIGLRFQETTANDLFGQVRVLGRLALAAPLLLPSAAGENALRALVGGFGVPLLPLAVLGAAVAARRRRQWYVAVGVCGLMPVLILHMIPVTQRYGYLAYPAIYLAATEGLAWLARIASAGVQRRRRVVLAVGAGALVAAQLYQANADLLGDYRFALAFGAP